MAPVVTDALILQTFPYGESSRIIRLLTREHGLQPVIAKGATRPRSRFCGLLEQFTSGSATIYLRPARELQTLTAFELTRARQALGRDLLRFGGAALLAELILRTSSEEPQPQLFTAVERGLDGIEAAADAALESTIIAVIWQIVARLGFAPALDDCLACGRALGPQEETRFSYDAGGTLCSDCGRSGGGVALPAPARRNLRDLVLGTETLLERTPGHWRLLERYLDHHVLEGGTLRSFEFLLSVLPNR